MISSLNRIRNTGNPTRRLIEALLVFAICFVQARPQVLAEDAAPAQAGQVQRSQSLQGHPLLIHESWALFELPVLRPILDSGPAATGPADTNPVDAKPPDQPLSPEEQGDLDMARKRYQAAIQAYREAPQNLWRVWNKMGMANQQMYIVAEAKKDYEMSLKLNPTSADVLNNLATTYYALKQYAIAEKYYRKALKVDPKSALIEKNLGTDLLAEDKFKKGWECYKTALALDPEIFARENQFRVGEPTPTQKRGAMNYFLAKSYARVGMLDRAVMCLRMAIDEGFTDRKKIMNDVEFASLRGVAAFDQLLAEHRTQ